MSIENISFTDLDQLKSLQPEGWPDITDEFEFYIRSDFCHPIKIRLYGKIVGIGVSIAFEKSAWLAHIIVDPNYRNRGLGYEIVNELIKNLRETRPIETFMLIATEIVDQFI